MPFQPSPRLAALACSLILAGCGGGDGGDAPIAAYSPNAALTSATQTPTQPQAQAQQPTAAAATVVINTTDREAVRASYNNVYLPQGQVSMDWSGSYDGCNAGSTSAAWQQAALGRINWFRAMAGVPADVQLSPDYTAKAQQAAYMMSVNKQMSHYPPKTWLCYTDSGAEAAGKSNLDLSRTGAQDIADGYFREIFVGNVVHRRWLLYPQLQHVGIGDVPGAGKTYQSANATWVLDENLGKPRPATRDGFVAWPPPGPVPYPTVYGRWSFSYPDADFKNAGVAVTLRGMSVTVDNINTDSGPGENTIAWRTNKIDDWVDWSRPAQDDVYEVTLTNVLIGGQARSFKYTVTVFDPAVAKP